MSFLVPAKTVRRKRAGTWHRKDIPNPLWRAELFVVDTYRGAQIENPFRWTDRNAPREDRPDRRFSMRGAWPCWIYAVFHGQAPLYVGKTMYLSQRIIAHALNENGAMGPAIIKETGASSLEFSAWKVCPRTGHNEDGDLVICREVERAMIWKLRPRLNQQIYRPRINERRMVDALR